MPTGESLPGDAQRAWQGLLTAHATLIRELDWRLRDGHGLGMSEFDVLAVLSGSERGVRMSDLASATMLSRAGLTHLVTRLERDRLAERAPDPADRRSLLVRLTPAGSGRLAGARATYGEVVRARFASRLSGGQLAQLARIWAALLPEGDGGTA